MIPLLILGANAEKSSGGPKMALTYLLGTLPRESIGASGAIMGLAGLGIINALKERSLPKLAVLGAYASLVLGIDMGPTVDRLAHGVGLASGLLTGGLLGGRKENMGQRIFGQRQAQKASMSFSA